MYHFNCYQPDNLEEACSLLKQYEDNVELMAGGTALLIDIHQNKRNPENIVALWDIANLDSIATMGGVQYTLGALTTITDIANEFRGDPSLTGLYEAAITFGSRQIQNVATVGGNLCKASPAADMVPMLLNLDAQVYLEGSLGKREMPLADFILGPEKTAIRSTEILTQIGFPKPKQRTGTAFFKKTRRKAVDLSIVSVAALITLAEDGETIAASHISLGAVAPVPFRAKKAEDVLKGQKLNNDLIRQAALEARQEAKPIDDVRASAEYRYKLIETLTQRAILKAAGRCK